MPSVEQLPAAVLDALASDMTIDITTFGRRSGKERRIEIWFLNIDGTLPIGLGVLGLIEMPIRLGAFDQQRDIFN